VLVGHSYAGSVVTGVADRLPERLSLLVYCDSAPLAAGQTMFGLNSPEGQAQLRKEVEESGDGWRIPPMAWEPSDKGASLKGLDEHHISLLRRRATPHPFGTYTQPLELTRSGPPAYRRAIVLCDDGKRVLAQARASLEAGEPYFQALAGNDWEFAELDTGHWPMLSAPADLARVLDDFAP
jgi:pimeloyl-ACP methyl ester carboxylesterase